MVVINRILCPIDFSDFSRHAFDHAVRVARGYDAVVHVVHVAPIPTAFVATVGGGGVIPTPDVDSLMHDRLLEDTRGFLDAGRSSGISVEYHVSEAPDPRSEILVQAKRLSVDLIVMGTHGRTGFQRLVFGSVTEKVLRESPIPVMTVPAGADGGAEAAGEPFKRILYATDFSADAERALSFAASLAQHCAASLTLVHVVEPLLLVSSPAVGLTFDTAGYEANRETAARATLRTWVPESIRLGCDTEDVVVRGRPYTEILRTATERNIDLIVLGVFGRGALDRMVFGSTAEHVIRRAKCPVLTTRG